MDQESANQVLDPNLGGYVIFLNMPYINDTTFWTLYFGLSLFLLFLFDKFEATRRELQDKTQELRVLETEVRLTSEALDQSTTNLDLCIDMNRSLVADLRFADRQIQDLTEFIGTNISRPGRAIN